MKKVFSVILFFLALCGVLYITKNIDPKDGVNLKDIKEITSLAVKDSEKLIKDLSKLKPEDQEKALDSIEKNETLKDKELAGFLKQQKNIAKENIDKFYKILYENFSKDPTKFFKSASKLGSKDLNNVFKKFLDKYIEKPKLMDDIEAITKDKSLTSDEKDKALKLLEEIKKNY